MKYRYIVNLQRLNSIRELSAFLAEVNRKLEDDGRFVCCLETTRLRRKRILNSYPRVMGQLAYFFDYLFNRVVPSVKGIHWINKRSSEKNSPVSYYEMLGRLSYCGFETIEEEEIKGRHYLVARKVTEAPAGEVRESYSLVVGLDRVGHRGKIIRVYKFRTMVAFSEYIQEHIYKKNSLCKKGKFKNDKRVTILGGISRKFWLDELPMIYNMLRREIKLVGVRPVSQQYLSLYDDDVIQLRTSVKPGLIPPFYADLPSTLKEIQESEVRYIRRWQKAPLRTDLIYLFRVAGNILFRGARSK